MRVTARCRCMFLRECLHTSVFQPDSLYMITSFPFPKAKKIVAQQRSFVLNAKWACFRAGRFVARDKQVIVELVSRVAAKRIELN